MLNIKTLSLIISIFFIGCGEQAPTSTVTTVSPTSKSSVEVLKLSKEDILTAINSARDEVRDCNDGLGLVGPAQPLTWNDNLYASAYEHSSDLAESNTFAHEGSGTVYDVTGSNSGAASLFNERIEANGYGEFRAVGENIAGGQESIEEAVQAWLDSPAHCTNIMSDAFSEVGVAVVVNPDSEYGIYWTQNFGTQK